MKASGISEEDLDAALERMKIDKLATLDNQLSWLRNAGFRQLDCWYKNYSFAVYSGSKVRPEIGNLKPE